MTMRKKSLFALMPGGLDIGICRTCDDGLLPDIAAKLSVSIPVAGHFISGYGKTSGWIKVKNPLRVQGGLPQR